VSKDFYRELKGLDEPESERKGGDTHVFGYAIFEEVEGARRSDDGSVAE
jgi:hypothetical protein